MNKVLGNKFAIFTLIFPGMAIFLFAMLVPIILSVYYGMTDYTGMGAANFIGLKNFKEIIFSDRVFWSSLWHAVILALVYMLIQHPVAVAFAIMLDKLGGKRERFFRTVYFIPCVISIVVTSYMWVYLYNYEYGLINRFLEVIGLGFLKQEWLGDPHLALWSVAFIAMWQGFGWAVLIYYADVKGIPEELYEAARIDGAAGLKTCTNITLPLLMPVIRVNMTVAVVYALKQMETVYLTTGGGPGNATQFLGNYLYIKAFNDYQYGYGNAISVLFVTACLAATVLLNKIFKSESYEY